MAFTAQFPTLRQGICLSFSLSRFLVSKVLFLLGLGHSIRGFFYKKLMHGREKNKVGNISFSSYCNFKSLYSSIIVNKQILCFGFV